MHGTGRGVKRKTFYILERPLFFYGGEEFHDSVFAFPAHHEIAVAKSLVRHERDVGAGPLITVLPLARSLSASLYARGAVEVIVEIPII